MFFRKKSLHFENVLHRLFFKKMFSFLDQRTTMVCWASAYLTRSWASQPWRPCCRDTGESGLVSSARTATCTSRWFRHRTPCTSAPSCRARRRARAPSQSPHQFTGSRHRWCGLNLPEGDPASTDRPLTTLQIQRPGSSPERMIHTNHLKVNPPRHCSTLVSD